MQFVDVLGAVAGTLTTIAFLPQVIKTWRTGATRDLSMAMFLALVVGIVLWLIYGVLRNDVPLILANGVTLVLAGVILFFKLRGWHRGEG
ncbi:MAG: SemiSWEET transporter [Alphaproteobacteria bacterium]|nr:SemiSWEET transporter [Alphaproteobacteria bacterium]